jgi:hypothetical protein
MQRKYFTSGKANIASYKVAQEVEGALCNVFITGPPACNL